MLSSLLLPALFSLLLAAIVGAVFYTQGFFRLPKTDCIGKVQFWHLLAGFGLYVLFQLALPWIVFTFFPGARADIYSIGLTFVTIICLLALALFFLWRSFARDVREEIVGPIKSLWGDIGLGAVTYALANPLTNLISQLIYAWIVLTQGSYTPQAQVAVAHLKSTFRYPLIYSLTFICFALIVPVIEEFLFRGLLQKWLSRLLSRPAFIGLTALLFALIHYSKVQGTTNYELIPSIFLLGLFLSYVREKRSLLTSMGLHVTFNTLSLLYITFAA